MAAQVVWWIVVPPREQFGPPVIPADAKIVSTQVGSQAYNDYLNNTSVPHNGYVRFMGPYPTKAAAQAASPHPLTLGDWVAAGIAGVMAGAGNEPSPPVSVGAGFAAGTAVDKVTGWTHNIEQWLIRGFEMLLGLGLIIVAVAKLASDTPIGRAAARAGKTAAVL